MALNAGAVIARFKADITDLKSGISEAKSAVSGFKDTASKMGESLSTSFAGFMNTAKVIGAVGAGAFTLFAKGALDLKNETDKANISLDIMATRFGHNAQEAKKLADSLGRELRIGTGAASEGLQNLIKSGLNLDQASDLMRRFTNEAMTGKSESISLADAVKNLSFAYATNNSALGNMSGVSENWSDITSKGVTVLENWNGKANKSAGITEELAQQITAYEESLKAQGKTLDASNPEMAKYVGLLQLTNLTAGSSARFQGTFTDNMAQMQLKINDVKLALGELLQNALNPLVNWFTNSGILDNLERFFRVIQNIGANLVAFATGASYAKEELAEALSFFFNGDMEKGMAVAGFLEQMVTAFQRLGAWIAENQETVLAFLKGMAVAIGALLIIGTVIGLINLLFNPITLIILAIGLLFVAWQNNFLGIRDITSAVVTWIIQVFNDMKAWWAEWGDEVMMIIRGVWDIIAGVFRTVIAVISGVIKTALALWRGDWQGAWEAIKTMTSGAWEGIKQIITGAIEVIKGALSALKQHLIGQLEEMWNKAKEIGGKIKGALEQISPFHKSSPSLVEYVLMGTDQIRDAYKALSGDISNMAFKAGVMDLGGVAGGIGQGEVQPGQPSIVNQNITQYVNDSADAQMINERLAYLYRNAT